MTASRRVFLSAIDEERFGINVARAPFVREGDFDSIIDFCRANLVRLLIARCPVSEIVLVQRMEREGFQFMDTLVYCTRDLSKTPLPTDPLTAVIRPFRHEDVDQITNLAALMYAGYKGHYHADPRLDRQRCDEVYTSWVYHSCVSRDVADEVIVVPDGDRIVAFVTLKLIGDGDGSVVVGGVGPAAQGRGLYRALLVKGLEWFAARHVQRCVVSTQITNVAVQRVWGRLGFELSHAEYTFHKWFDPT